MFYLNTIEQLFLFVEQLDLVVHDFGFFLPSGFLSVLTNIIFSNSDFLSGIAK